MTETEVTQIPPRASALSSEYQAGTYGNLSSGPGVELTERKNLAMIQVESVTAEKDTVCERLLSQLSVMAPTQPNRAAGNDDLRIIATGPGRWLIVEPETRDLETALFKLLQGLDTAVVDLSHARAVIRLSGEAARQVLSKGSGVDFHRNSFRSGDVAQTALFHVSALIDCVDNVPTCDLFVPRGFALAFWQHLRHACAEYGYSVV